MDVFGTVTPANVATEHPRKNRRYWTKKIARNKERDQEHVSALNAKGWRVLVIWECETKDIERLGKRVRAYLA